MKSKKNKHKTAEIPKAFRDTLIELAEGLLPYYKIKIPFWDEKERRILEGYTPSDAEIENLPLQLDPTYLTTKWSLFHPATWFFSQQAMFNVVHNPLFFTYDYILQILFPAPDLKSIQKGLEKLPEKTHDEIIQRHQLAVTSFRDLFYLSEQYYEKLGRELYGRKIFDHFSHPGKLSHGEHPLTSLAKSVYHANKRIANMVDVTDGIYRFDEMNENIVSKESFSVIFESIWHFIQKRTQETLSLEDYIPPKLQPGPMKELYCKFIDAIEEDDKKIMALQKDAIIGSFRALKQNAYNRLVDHVRYKKRKPIRPPHDITDEVIDQFNLLEDNTFDMSSEDVDGLLNQINSQLTRRQKRIANAYLRYYSQDQKPTQTSIARELHIDVKTLRKEIQCIRKTYLENKSE
jgi:hypothetical protein